jgi:predicted nucleotide-binding protein (sugar kinase/HSP70/actin superfamily)
MPPVIGIPKTLYYYIYPDLWETFFRALGVEVLFSKTSTTRTIERASLISEAEHCLPIKLFDAHLAEVVEMTDVVFVPRLLSGLKNHIACPKMGALPDAARADIASGNTVLTVDINENKTPLSRSLRSLGRMVGAKKGIVDRAAAEAIKAMIAAREKRSVPPSSGRMRFLFLGHPYNLHDPFISGPIVSKLRDLKIDVEMVSFGARDLRPDPIRWDTCSEMYHKLLTLSPSEYGGVIQISSFNCGCDSIVNEFYRELLKEKGIPYLILVKDEHSAQAGVDTRLEAFVDSIGW